MSQGVSVKKFKVKDNYDEVTREIENFLKSLPGEITSQSQVAITERPGDTVAIIVAAVYKKVGFKNYD